jgi:hypothetical protein
MKSREHLKVACAELAEARRVLVFSASRVSHLNEKVATWSPDEAERVEAYLARFSRAVDLLTNKTLRALFRHELEPEGSVLDRIYLAEKRGLILNVERMRILKELRNRIAHDYAGGLTGSFLIFARHEQGFFETCADATVGYTARYL